MGTVYEAYDLRLNTVVAVKEAGYDDPPLRRQFEREARILAGLRHHGMPRVTDYFGEGEGQFLVMDYIPGKDLWEILRERNRAFPPNQVIDWAEQILDLLIFLHGQDPPIIHRDIKPQNLKLNSSGQIILLDFGLAKQTNFMTSSRSVLGYSASYAPLEQIQGTGTEPRSDVYSLGATMYHLSTNEVPPDILTRLSATTNGAPDPLLSLLPPANGLERVIQQAMSIGVNQRFDSALQMRQVLSEVSSGVVVKQEAEPTQPGPTMPSKRAHSVPVATLPISRPEIYSWVDHSESKLPEEASAPVETASEGFKWKRLVLPTFSLGILIVISIWALSHLGSARNNGVPGKNGVAKAEVQNIELAKPSPIPSPSPSPSPTALVPQSITPPGPLINYLTSVVQNDLFLDMYQGSKKNYADSRTVKAVDLNQDGTPEYIVELAGCGSGGCSVRVYQKSGNSYIDLSGGDDGDMATIMFGDLANEKYGYFRAGPEMTNGYLNLHYRHGKISETFWFDGKYYKLRKK